MVENKQMSMMEKLSRIFAGELGQKIIKGLKKGFSSDKEITKALNKISKKGSCDISFRRTKKNKRKNTFNKYGKNRVFEPKTHQKFVQNKQIFESSIFPYFYSKHP